MIPPEFIDDLLSRADITDFVGDRVKLRKAGQNFSGLCPFHNEKTPSFTVSQEKQFYHCFGCQAHGNVIGFVMEFDRLDFPGAVELIAQRLGISVPQSNDPKARDRAVKRKSQQDILEQVMQFYCRVLREHPQKDVAVSYLKSRHLSGEVARDFNIGYAPPGWSNLEAELAKTNHERDLLRDAGMLIERDDERTYDRFRERIMFPIRDQRGRVIAFGGRALGDANPKYLNSPETELFHKGKELYGLFEARRSNARLESLLVVEGYMDVVALAQHGITHAVATLGTATTADHLTRLYKMVTRVVFCFDGDAAGKAAAWKALLVALPFMTDGRSARFLFLPEGEDPDSMVRAEGQEGFANRLAQAEPLPDFFFRKLKSEQDVTSLDGRAALSKLAMGLISTMPRGVFRELMVNKLSEMTNLSAESSSAPL